MKYFIPVFSIVLGGICLCTTVPAFAVPIDSVVVRKKAVYPGGQKELEQYLSLNLRYPTAALEQQISGEVWISFLIGEDGIVRNATVEKGIGWGCDEEALRVVNSMPNWRPAYKSDGSPVQVKYLLPVVFELKEYK